MSKVKIINGCQDPDVNWGYPGGTLTQGQSIIINESELPYCLTLEILNPPPTQNEKYTLNGKVTPLTGSQICITKSDLPDVKTDPVNVTIGDSQN